MRRSLRVLARLLPTAAAALVLSGVAAADWVGQHKRSRVLISTTSCSPSLWTGNSDGSLPFAAGGSPFSFGLNMTPAAGQTFTAGKLGSFTVGADNTVLLGPPYVFDAANINQFNF